VFNLESASDLKIVLRFFVGPDAADRRAAAPLKFGLLFSHEAQNQWYMPRFNSVAAIIERHRFLAA
jgi:hypothetical protein